MTDTRLFNPTHFVKARLPQSALRAPLNSILGAQANVRVLRELVMAGIPLAAGELARRARLGRTSVYPVLKGLEETGVVAFVGAGALRQVSFRKSHPLARPLAALFQAERSRVEQLIETLREHLRDVQPPPIAAWVEGPVLANEDRLLDSIPLFVLSHPKTLPAMVDRISKELESIEKVFDVQFEVHAQTRSELSARPQEVLDTLSDVILLSGVPPASLVNDQVRPSRKSRMHQDHDSNARRLAVGVAAKLRWDPSLARLARRQLMKRAKSASPQEQRELQEWIRIFSTMSPSRLQRFLTERGERADRLRQTLPAFDLLTPRERKAVLSAQNDGEVRAAIRVERRTR